METLYHFFSRKCHSPTETIKVLDSILTHGIRLTPEIVDVPWKDFFGKNNRPLKIEQYRFCLTAASSSEELLLHSEKFGDIGIGFNSSFVLRVGGFPVFYIPTPNDESIDLDEYRGVSLLYRISEAQELLEFLLSNRVLVSKDIDIENVLGAIRFLGNICYPTQRLVSSSSRIVNYYNQREWRLIYGLISKNAQISKIDNYYLIRRYDGNPIANYVTKVVVKETSGLLKQKYHRELRKLLKTLGLQIRLEYF